MPKEYVSSQTEMFLRLIRTGQLPKEILPNSAPNYTEAKEKRDTEYYARVFLNSACYDFVKNNEAVEYNGE